MKVEKRGDKWCVVREDGSVVSKHATEADATAACSKERKDGATDSVRRFDLLERLDGPRLDPETGWLRATALISRIGIQEYRTADGKVQRELRVPDEVFHKDSLDSFSMVPVTDDHPPGGMLLDAKNTRDLQRGHLGEKVEPEGERVRARVLITDADLIKKVLHGKAELSCGYTCDLDRTPGEWKGQRYDARQIGIRGNHVAVVDAGRAGPGVRLRLDSGDAVSIRADRHEDANPAKGREHTEESHMVKIRIDGIEVEVANEQAAQLITRALEDRSSKADAALKGQADAEKAAEKARADAATAATAAKSDLDKATARADVAEGKVKDLEKARTDAASKVPDLVRARVALEKKAAEILGAEEKLDALSDRQVKEKVLGKLSPSIKVDGKDDVYVDTAYQATLDAAGEEALAALRSTVRTPPAGDKGAAKADAAAARKKMLDAQEKAWQPAEAAK